MIKKPDDQKGATDQPVEADKIAEPPPDPAPAEVKSVAEREVAVLVGEQVVVDRENNVLGREEVVLGREETVLGREEVALAGEEVIQSREQATDKREETADLRENAATLREQAMRTQEEAGRDTAARSARIEAQLRQANDDLVVAAANVKTMAETAELTSSQMSYMAEHDFLTGLPNRSRLIVRLAESIVLARHHNKKVALLCLDLDQFKNINDSLGHAIGDRVLQAVAERMQTCVRHSDIISRQGGDEFMVVLSEVDSASNVSFTAEKLIKAMTEPHFLDGHRLHVTLSIGISIYPDDAMDVDAMLRDADIAMHHAKQCGRNNYQMFTPEMNVRAVARQSIAEALHHALNKQEFVLVYQPKVDLETGLITGAEALIRWQQPDLLIYPTQFISIAEECGLILPIGQWVMREACRQTQAWVQAGLNVGVIAVNVSSVEIHHKDFFAGVYAILNETGLDPHRLEIELTESGLMQDTESTMTLLHALKDLGIQIAIDDFGTGYSSLSYLRRFPIDTLKIDQSFVQGIDGETGEAIVSAIIAMGTSLKQRVVAEGIETREQLDFLLSKHCTQGQGYYFSRPVSAQKFAELLAVGKC